MYRRRMKLLLLALVAIVTVSQLTGCLPWPFNRKPAPSPVGQNTTLRQGSFVPAALPVSSGASAQQRILWLVDHSDRYLVPFVLSVPKVEGMAREAVNRLIDTAANRSILASTGLKLPLPQSTSIRGLTIRDGLAKVDFSDDLLRVSREREKLAVDAVVYTLTEFPNVEKVQIMVGGKVLQNLPGGTAVGGPLTRQSRPLNQEAGAPTGQATSTVVLYFSSSSPEHDYNYYVPVTRVIAQVDNTLSASIRELISGPASGSGLFHDVPASVKLNSVRVNAMKVAEVDMTSQIYEYGSGAVAETAVLGALILTVTGHSHVEGIKITVDGKAPRFPQGTDVGRPIARPLFVNPFII